MRSRCIGSFENSEAGADFHNIQRGNFSERGTSTL